MTPCRRRLPGLVFASALLAASTGCGVLPRESRTAAPALPDPVTAAEAVELAAREAQAGRWTAALQVIDTAEGRFPGDPALAGHRARLAAQWARERREIDDGILVGDAENLAARVAMLDRLTAAEPDRLAPVARRALSLGRLRERLPALLDCAERHVETAPDLARRCYDVVAGIGDPAAAGRLAAVGERIESVEQERLQRERARAQRERRQRGERLVEQARAAVRRADHEAALRLLDRAAALNGETREITDLRRAARAGIAPQVATLVRLGDRLYLDEQPEAALATWQAALQLRPGDPGIEARIERARAVLRRLERLRQDQGQATPTGAGDR